MSHCTRSVFCTDYLPSKTHASTFPDGISITSTYAFPQLYAMSVAAKTNALILAAITMAGANGSHHELGSFPLGGCSSQLLVNQTIRDCILLLIS